MIESDIKRVIDQVSRDRGIDREVLIKTMEEALKSAARKKFGINVDIEVHYNEEVGELCNEVLAFKGAQRAEKLVNSNQESLEGEFADVMITTLILARTMDVDIEAALKNKLEKICERFDLPWQLTRNHEQGLSRRANKPSPAWRSNAPICPAVGRRK